MRKRLTDQNGIPTVEGANAMFDALEDASAQRELREDAQSLAALKSDVQHRYRHGKETLMELSRTYYTAVRLGFSGHHREWMDAIQSAR